MSIRNSVQFDALERIEDEEHLDELLTTPGPELIEAIREFESPLVILGAGGKMGPTLAVLARRAAEAAAHELKVIAVSRFSNSASREWLHSRRVETVAADLLNRNEVAQLPNSPNVVYLVGMKFGTSQSPSLTWATNTVAPMLAAERYAGARMVALSTGNVYPMSSVDSTGSHESDPLTPLGEYANAAVARERVFEYFSLRDDSPLALIRLNYAHDVRYGVISDLAQRIVNRQPIDLTMGYFNAIWQGDANDLILRAVSLCGTPPAALNLTSPEIYRVRDVAQQLAEHLGVSVEFEGSEAETALLSDATRLVERLGRPHIGISKLIDWIADWTRRGGRTLGKPTGFETRDGKF